MPFYHTENGDRLEISMTVERKIKFIDDNAIHFSEIAIMHKDEYIGYIQFYNFGMEIKVDKIFTSNADKYGILNYVRRLHNL